MIHFVAPPTPSIVTMHRDDRQAELAGPSELNYDVQPVRIRRLFRPGLSHMAGLSQLGMPQTAGGFGSAYLPPPVALQPMQQGTRGLRNIGGAYGLGRPSATTLHIPSVLVPKTVG